MTYHYEATEDIAILHDLKQKSLDSLLSPADGMWQSFRDMSQHWSIKSQNDLIDFACLDDRQNLLQYFLIDQFLYDGKANWQATS